MSFVCLSEDSFFASGVAGVVVVALSYSISVEGVVVIGTGFMISNMNLVIAVYSMLLVAYCWFVTALFPRPSVNLVRGSFEV